jgi:LPPG:FO 2-phospho-L-lactate transferase
MSSRSEKKLIALSGGVGGAKLAHGLAQVLPPERLLIVTNTGDDFTHLGLRICPDLDTVMYTLAGIANPDTLWGVAGETWQFMDALGELGGPTWFRLGDRDLATHVTRTHELQAGQSLTDVTDRLCERLGVRHPLLPMSDDPVATRVMTTEGEIAFQEYFVARRCAPSVSAIRFDGAAVAHVNPRLTEALRDPALGGIVICPSNPYLSIDPILALPGMREALLEARVPIIAVTPIIGGTAVKGPTAKIMGEIGITPSALSIAQHYRGLIDGFVLDTIDAALAPAIEALGLRVLMAPALMPDLDAKTRLAAAVLRFVERLGADGN